MTAEEFFKENPLRDRVMSFAYLFDDMFFKQGIREQYQKDNGEWVSTFRSLPPELEYFDFDDYTYIIEDLEPGVGGFYDKETKTLCVIPSLLQDDYVILHEMIHLTEDAINKVPMFFHDALFWAFYTDLRKKIQQLDEIIFAHTHVENATEIYDLGGDHDTLFLLKSFDLDIKMGYPLGTVFAYGRTERFKNYSYSV